MAALVSPVVTDVTPLHERPPRGTNRLGLRLVISIPAILILVALAYGLVSYLSFSVFWDDLDKVGAGEIARNLLRIHMNALIALAFVSVVAGLILSSTILRPIRALLEATRQVTQGRLNLRATTIPSAREIEDLSHSFDQMIDTLRQSIGERDRRLMECIPIGVLTTDMDGLIGAVSPLACEILGLPAGQIMGRRINELGQLASRPVHVLVEYLLARIYEHPAQSTAEVTLGDAGGNKSLTVNSTLLRDGHGAPFGFMFSMRQAKRRRNLAVQLTRNDQLAALGTFTLGLAHELRNPLGAIKGFSQLLLLEHNLSPRVVEFLARMIFEVDRVDGLVRQLFDLSEQPLACRVPTSLNKILEEATELARRDVEPDKVREIKLRLDLRPLPPLLLEQDRLVQAFGKIIQNAYEFSGDGGTITLCTRHEARTGGDLWRVEVRNTGSAIDSADLRLVFEPFHTTKEKATGLGLTIASQIIAQNGGRLDAAMDGEEVVFTALLANVAPATGGEVQGERR